MFGGTFAADPLRPEGWDQLKRVYPEHLTDAQWAEIWVKSRPHSNLSSDRLLHPASLETVPETHTSPLKEATESIRPPLLTGCEDFYMCYFYCLELQCHYSNSIGRKGAKWKQVCSGGDALAQ